MKADTRRPEVTWFALALDLQVGWLKVSSTLHLRLSAEDCKSTVLILALQMSFREQVNLQIRMSWVMRFDSIPFNSRKKMTLRILVRFGEDTIFSLWRRCDSCEIWRRYADDTTMYIEPPQSIIIIRVNQNLERLPNTEWVYKN